MPNQLVFSLGKFIQERDDVHRISLAKCLILFCQKIRIYCEIRRDILCFAFFSDQDPLDRFQIFYIDLMQCFFCKRTDLLCGKIRIRKLRKKQIKFSFIIIRSYFWHKKNLLAPYFSVYIISNRKTNRNPLPRFFTFIHK